MSVGVSILRSVGRRVSKVSRWIAARLPSGPHHRPPAVPLLALVGVGLITLLAALAVLGIWLSDGDDSSPILVPARTSPVPGALRAPFRLAVWDGGGWQFNSPPEGVAYSEGEAVPFLLRIDEAGRDAPYLLVIRYDCKGFALLTSYGRDHGSGPALASGGPESSVADTNLSIPDDPGTGADDAEAGSLSLWGGTFTGVSGPLPSSACTGEKTLALGLRAAADTLYLMWGAEISPGALERHAQLRLAVHATGVEELSIEIEPESVGPAQP